MINALLLLLGCQFAGEMLVHFLGLTIPGPVVGMLILLIGLLLNGSLPDCLDSTASHFIRYIGLLFVPAGAGISLYLDLLAQEWLVILVASFSSTVLTLILTAYVFKALEKTNNASAQGDT